MIPNTYHWLQSVCLPLPPTKHLNSRTLWWVEGWKLLLPVCLLSYTSPFSSFHLFIFLHIQSNNFSFALFHPLSHHLSSCSYFYLSMAFPSSVSSFFLHPPPSSSFPFSFPLAGCSHIFACSCEGVSDVRVAHGGRGSSRAWREHTLWELPFITPSPNEQHAECNTDAITFRNSFS